MSIFIILAIAIVFAIAYDVVSYIKNRNQPPVNPI